MINMITNRRCIATLLSCVLLTIVYAYRSPSNTSTAIKQPVSSISAFDMQRPVPDLEEAAAIASQPLTNVLVSVIETPPAETWTSQPIQPAYAPQIPQPRQQQVPPTSPTIEKPVPPNYQGVDPVLDVAPPKPSNAIQEDNNLDALMRGPLHEAYAEVYQYDPKPTVVIDRKPPEPIDELPPEFKPEGENVVWIPGYWAWDDQRNDFIWISGLWRNTPTGQRWVGGYWQSAGNGYRWVSGFWTSDQQEQLSYLPQPPASLDNGPSYRAPSDDHYYAPGNWVYQNNVYVWRSGYWAPRLANRVWIPARYIWTPYGCIYRPGFWDWEFYNRGVLFAPVCFRAPVYRQVDYCYQPTFVVNTNVDFMAHLFVRPNFCHYYFGDWYNPRYASQNFYAWSNYYHGYGHRRVYDPLYSYYNCRSSRYNNAHTLSWVRQQHAFYHLNHEYRPKRTFYAQFQFTKQHGHEHFAHGAVRRANYGERYDDHIHRKRRGHGHERSTRYSKVDVSDRIDAIAVSREISRRRQSQDHRHDDNGRDHRKHVKLDLPKTKYTSVKRASANHSDVSQIRKPTRTKKSEIRVPEDVRRKFERHAKQQTDKRQRPRNAADRNQERINRAQVQAADKQLRSRPGESKQLAQQRDSEALKLESSRLEEQRREQRFLDKQKQTKQQQVRDKKRIDQIDQPRVQQKIQNRRQELEKRDEQYRQAVQNAKRRNRPIEAGRLEEERREATFREKQRQEENRKQVERALQQRESEQRAKKQRAAQKRATESQSRKLGEAQQRAASAQSRKNREAQERAAKQQLGRTRADQKRTADQQAQKKRDAQRRARQQEANRRDSQLQTQRQRDAQQQAQRQRDARQQAQRQREAKLRSDEQRVQRQRAPQQQAQRQRDAQRQAQPQLNAQRQARQQSETQQQAQRQRDAQKQAQRQRETQQQAQRQRDAQKQAQRQRDVQKQAQRQRAAQKQAQRQRDAQRQAQRQREAQQQAQRQREAKQRSDQQRAQRQRESQQRAQQQRAQRQRESQQRAQRDAQQRAQRDAQQRAQREAQRQRNRSKGKKK